MIEDLERSLIARFQRRHGRRPRVLVRAPGRVNLIGEHTDYSLLPVLPIAIDRYTLLAVCDDASNKIIASSRRFETEAVVDRDALPRAGRGWQRYLVGVLEELAGLAPGMGARVMVDGDLPTAGGLSSSSSLSVGLLSGLNAAWGLGLDGEQLVARAVVAERHVGVESGGMDQTVITLARAGCALRIDFDPPRRRAVPIPAGLRVVAASSGQEAPKGGTVQRAYNSRVIGCRLAAALLAFRLGLEPGQECPTLGHIAKGADVQADVPALPRAAAAAEVARITGRDARPLVRLTGGSFPADEEVLIRPAARHVLGEARRVDEAEQALRDGDPGRLGELLNESHRSLSRDFQCSTGALDRLCDAMVDAGARGARLTGAGFGGYAVAVTDDGRVQDVIARAEATTGDRAFQVIPGRGAVVDILH